MFLNIQNLDSGNEMKFRVIEDNVVPPWNVVFEKMPNFRTNSILKVHSFAFSEIRSAINLQAFLIQPQLSWIDCGSFWSHQVSVDYSRLWHAVCDISHQVIKKTGCVLKIIINHLFSWLNGRTWTLRWCGPLIDYNPRKSNNVHDFILFQE